MSNGGKSGRGGGLLLKRIGAGGVALLQTGYAFLVLRNQLIAGFDLFGFSLGSCAAVSGVFFGWIALGVSSIKNQKRIRSALFFGCILGLLGFVAGFFGPMIFTPESNMGPILGILLTGPLGFVVGSLFGWFYSNAC